MKRAIDEMQKDYYFKARMTEAEAERIREYVRETGVKRGFLVRKALLRYLDEQNS